MSDPYFDFFLNAAATIVQLETIELSHPGFSQVYRIVRNKTDGLTATLETSETVDFDYYPLRINQGSSRDDLDYSFNIDFGDLGEVLPTELDNVLESDSFDVKPTLIYRTYRSDDLSAPMYGPITLEIIEISFQKTGASFEAKAPRINLSKTGEVYSVERFPTLRGFL